MGQPYSYAKNFADLLPDRPWVVTRRELPDARNLDMEVRVNGASRRKGNTKDMIFDPYEALAYCSDYTVMEPGDVISLGTFAGFKRIEAGDDVELEIARIGTLQQQGGGGQAALAQFRRRCRDRAAGAGEASRLHAHHWRACAVLPAGPARADDIRDALTRSGDWPRNRQRPGRSPRACS